MTQKEAYKKGIKRAIRLYAVWRSGEQYVGDACTIDEATANVNKTAEHYWPIDSKEDKND